MGRPQMRICIISDASLETPHPVGHGLGAMNWQIAEGLHARGHDVTLIAKAGSRFSGRLVTLNVEGYQGEPALANAAYTLHKQQPFDVFLDGGHIHRLSAIFPHLPVVNVYHDNYQPYQRCAVVLSEGQRALLPPPFESARIIPNALPREHIVSSDVPGTYAVFLGAISDLKQPLLAIEACARMGVPLVIAGMTVNNFGLALTRMNNARYIGPIGGASKFALLRGARLLLQLSGVESFGLTTLEAMLSGTPVVALPAGGSVDLIEYGASGILVQPSGDAVGAVCDAMKAAWWLDRAKVRQSAERFGCVDRQIEAYEDALADAMRGEWW
jgi:glycosyltransferase involved in cell wall biosynthesis